MNISSRQFTSKERDAGTQQYDHSTPQYVFGQLGRAKTHQSTTVSLSAVADAGDLNSFGALWFEQYAVVAATEPELSPGRLEFLDVA